MRRIILAILMMVILLVAGAAGCSQPADSVESRAPDFTLQNLEGDMVSLKDFRGRPVVVNFWATWCGYCREEMPYFQQIDNEWPDSELVILMINVAERKSTVESYINTFNYSFTVLLDSRRTVSDSYNTFAYPTTFFIDKDGIIREKVTGAFVDKSGIEYYLKEIVP